MSYYCHVCNEPKHIVDLAYEWLSPTETDSICYDCFVTRRGPNPLVKEITDVRSELEKLRTLILDTTDPEFPDAP